ncbi:MAG: DUF4340 domain-containing protein [Planctomycetes bacterium]|nr:DUF4340 domain-containing protein [Planctomycetota bacterium]
MKRSIVLLVITLVVAAWVWWFEVRPKSKVHSTDDKQQLSKTLVGAKKDEIKGFTLVKAGQEPITVQLVNDEWVLAAPVQASAEEAAVKKVLWDLEWTEKMGEPIPAAKVTAQRLEAYGLDKPRGSVDVTTTTGEKHFVIGGLNPGGELVYVREGENGPVHLVRKDFAEHLDVTVFQMRNKTVITLAPGQVRFIKIFGSSKAVLSKDGDHWDMTDPFRDYADPEVLNTFLEAAGKLKVLSFVSDDPATYTEYGLDEPQSYITVGEGRGGGKVITVNFGNNAPGEDASPEMTYARIEGERAVFTLPAADVKALFVRVEDLQAKAVVRMDPYAVKKVSAAYGLRQVELAKPDFDWKIVKPFEAPADNARVKALLDTFKKARIVKYVTPEPDEARYGLDIPTGSFSYVEGDKQPVGIVFGKKAAEALVYAKRTDMPGVFTVSEDIFEELATPALDYHTKEMQTVSMNEVKALRIERGDESYRFEQEPSRDTTVNWRMVQPVEAPANTYVMMHLAIALATTRAVDLVERSPQDISLYGLDKPAIRIGFEMSSPEEAAPGTLLIGKAAESGDSYAMLEGGDVVFTVKKVFVRTLGRELRDTSVFAFTRGAAQEIEFRKGKKSWVLKKADGKWSVESPEGYAVATTAVEDELGNLAAIETSRFVSYKTEKLATYGLEKPQAVVRVISPSGVAALSVGDMAKSGHYYATSTTVEGVFLLTPGDLLCVLEPGKLIEEKTAQEASEVPAAGPTPLKEPAMR